MNAESMAGVWAGLTGRACWQGGLFILGAAAVCRLFPRLPAAVRCWLWWLACFKLLCALISIAPLSLTLLPGSAPRTAIGAARDAQAANPRVVFDVTLEERPAVKSGRQETLVPLASCCCLVRCPTSLSRPGRADPERPPS